MRHVAIGIALFLILTAACGTPDRPSPTAPSRITTLSLQSDWPNQPSPNAVGIAPTTFRQGLDPGMIWIAVVVSGNNVSMLRGELRWDGALLQWAGWGEPDWWQSGGALCDWTYYDFADNVSFFLERPSTSLGLTGTGEVIYIQLRPKYGVFSGTSRLQWNDPRLYGPGSSSRALTGGIYGGTITITSS